MQADDQDQCGNGVASRCVLRVRGDTVCWENDQLAVEVPVALKVAGETALVMLATPCDMQDYALGFCLSEGIIADTAQLRAVRVHERLEGIELDLDLAPDAARKLIERSRAMEGRSGCGWCGAASLEQVVSVLQPVRAQVHLERTALRVAFDALPTLQPLNAACGAVHAAAWCDERGRVLALREDVGRHNALDKLIGGLHAKAFEPDHGFVLLSSRASFEMVTKAARVGIAVVAAISAPTALAVALAEQADVTLIGFARSEDYVVYSHARRVRPDAPACPAR